MYGEGAVAQARRVVRMKTDARVPRASHHSVDDQITHTLLEVCTHPTTANSHFHLCALP